MPIPTSTRTCLPMMKTAAFAKRGRSRSRVSAQDKADTIERYDGSRSPECLRNRILKPFTKVASLATGCTAATFAAMAVAQSGGPGGIGEAITGGVVGSVAGGAAGLAVTKALYGKSVEESEGMESWGRSIATCALGAIGVLVGGVTGAIAGYSGLNASTVAIAGVTAGAVTSTVAEAGLSRLVKNESAGEWKTF